MAKETWNVLLPASIDPVGPDSISEFATFTRIDEYEDGEEFLDDCDRFDAMIVRVTELSEAVIDAATNLKVISKHGAGLDNVDIPAATERGVVVCNTPGANSRSVAEHALTLVLAARRQVVRADAHVRDGGWDRHTFTSSEFSGETLGLFGLGNIAQELVDLTAGFDLNYLAYDPYVDQSDAPDGVEMVADTERLFEESDVVSVHAPLTEQTHHAIGAAELSVLGPEGIIVNTARGGIIDEAALADALEEGPVSAAGLDVFENEPPEEGDEVLLRDDVVRTPHVGGVTTEALERMSRRAAANVRTVYEGGIPDSTVNRDGLGGAE